MKLLKRMLAFVLTVCMMFTVVPVYADAGKMPVVDTATVDAMAYYDLEAAFASTGTNTSINKHYIVGGLYVDEAGEAFLILGKEKNNTVKDIDFVQVEGYEAVTEPEQFYVKGLFTINLPKDDSVVFDHGEHGHIIISIGAFANLSETFRVVAECSENGWDIGEIEITLKTTYKIEKEVTPIYNEAGEILLYTVKAENTGEHTISKINVYDDVPTGLTVIAVNGVELDEYVVGSDAENEIILAADTILTPAGTEDAIRFYELTAVVNEDYKSGPIVNTAILSSIAMVDVWDDAVYTPPSYFYVYHSATGETEKIRMTDELLNGGLFDVTEAYSAGTNYSGLTAGTLYGGTFADEARETVYPFAEGENGIGFTPEAGETYYVHEPNTKYLRPMVLSVWATPEYEAQFDVKEAYLFTAVDRDYYNFIGFDVDYVAEELSGADKTLYGTDVYNSVKMKYADNVSVIESGKVYTMANTFKLPGHLSFLQLPDFRGYENEVFTVRPYWVTMDNVKVTGTVTRSLKYVGVQPTNIGKQIQPGTGDKTTCDVVGESIVDNYNVFATSRVRLIDYFDATLQDDIQDVPSEPVIPEEPETPDFTSVAATITAVTAGKSDNVKSLNLSYSIAGYSYVDAGFVVNYGEGDEVVLADVDENNMVTANYSLNALKKGAVIEIKPYWTDEDGNTTYGASSTVTYKKQRIVE